MLALELQTGVCAFTFFARSSTDNSFPPECIETAGSLQFLNELIPPKSKNKNHITLVQLFEQWCCLRSKSKSFLAE